MSVKRTSADVVVLAGDIHKGTRAIDWIDREFGTLPVLYVLGNHEYYDEDYATLVGEFRQRTLGTNVHLLENEVITIGDVNFFGCTLWTDFELLGSPHLAMKLARQSMSDYFVVHNSANNSRLEPQETQSAHYQSTFWLAESLRKHKGEMNIVITHHGPSEKSIALRYKRDSLNPCFVSNIEWLVKEHTPDVWIHGHLHNNVEYQLHGCQVLTNMRGYPGEGVEGFDSGKLIDIASATRTKAGL